MNAHAAIDHGAGPVSDGAVQAEQIRLLYGATDFVRILLIGLVAAHITAAVLWNLYPSWAVVAWLALVDIVALARFLLWRRFQRKPPDEPDAERWGVWFTLGIAAFGGLWGLLASVVFVTDNPAYYVFVVFALGAMTIGATLREAAYLPAFYGFAAPAAVPMSFALVTRGGLEPVAMGLMLIVLVLALIPVGRNNNRWIGDNIRLRIEEKKLNDELWRTTADLNAEIVERQQAEEKTRFTNLLLTTAMEGSPDGILVVDNRTRILSYNRRFVDLWHLPPELPAAGADEPVLRAVTSQLRDPESFLARVKFLYDHPEEVSRERLELNDGRLFDRHSGTLYDSTRKYLGRVWFFRDITERERATVALQQRDALLHAVAASATEFVTAPSLDEAMPRALELVSKTVQIERMAVLESPTARDAAPKLRYAWNAPDIPVAIDRTFFEQPGLASPEFAAWQSPLYNGETVLADVPRMTGDVKRILSGLGVKTLLLVPIETDGKNWGHIGLVNSKQERQWQPFEIEVLKMLAELIGNTIQRDRYVKELADANRIIQDTPTILYRLSGEPSLPVTYVSQNIRLFGYDPAALIVSPHFFLNIVHPDDAAKVRATLTEALEENSGPAVVEYRLLTSRGTYRWVENRFTPVRDAAGRLIEIEGILIDVTERKAAEEKIALLARTDALTGLANRATFIERLRHSFAAARRGAPSFAVLYLDLDRFKDVNDTLGHPVGDLLLETVAKRLESTTREIDLVGRPGGDEFAVLQTDLSDPADAGALAAKIRAALAVPFHLAGNELHLTASVGISTYAPDIASADDMLAQADLALYRAKDEGRDQYRFHSEELDAQVRERVSIAEELRVAIERDEIELYYQPQVELHTGRIVGMEALVRWNHPTRGLLEPAAFIAVAEKSGAMMAIGQWVLDCACRQMSLWRKAGIAPPVLAVNVSVAQLKTANEFVQSVGDTLAKWNLEPADLELDVTEAILAHATLAQNDVLERLRALGVKIAIDDFGTKYSSLDYLRTYRVSRLKIPQRIVDAATQDPNDGAMVRAIIGIARELDIDVVAQGVETEAQWSFLSATSPKAKVQGFYYSKPVPAERAAQLLRRGRIDPPAAQAASPARSKATA